VDIRVADMPELLAAIRARPEMYFGQKSVHDLWLFLYGFWFAESFHKLPREARIRGFDLEVFEVWVKYRFNPKRLSVSSFSLAARIASTEDGGFDLWFRWYDEFAASPRPSRAMQVALSEGGSVQAVVTAVTRQGSGDVATAEFARWHCPCGSWMVADTETANGDALTVNCGFCARRYEVHIDAGQFVGIREVDHVSG
jgi:hypothetical protein